MNEKEFDKKLKNGEIKEVKEDKEETPEKKDILEPSLEDYIDSLEILKRFKRAESNVPIFTPKGFINQFWFYLSGTTYRLYVYIKDGWKKVYDSDGFAPAAHKVSHQDGGTDEINVGGLSGELADNQPPKAHALNAHSVPTGDISMDTNKITNVADPAANQDVATRKWVEDNAPGNKFGIGTQLWASNDTDKNFTDAAYVEQKRILVRKGGNFKISFRLASNNGMVYGKIYVNGVPVGTERNRGSGGPTQYTEDILGINAGESIQIFCYITVGTGTLDNFRLSVDGYEDYTAS